VLELRSVRGTGGGPEKTILLGAARSDPGRYAITVCYIRDLRDRVFSIGEWAKQLGVDYVEVEERHSFDFSIWQKLKQLVTARQIDILHSHDYKTNLYAWLLGRHCGAIPLATLHGYTGHSWRERVYYAADKRIVSRFPMTIAVSGELRRELIRTGSTPERVVRVLNAIDDRQFFHDPTLRDKARAALGIRDGEFVIGSVGRAERQKRFDLLMVAFADIRARRPDITLRLVIVGGGSLQDELTRLRERLGLTDSCVLAGHRSDIGFVHHGLDLFVQSSEYEGTPNAVLEAMAFETPIVATDVGGTSELVTDGEHGLIVPSGDASVLATAIERVIDGPAAAQRRSAAARRRVEDELSFRARMSAVERVYDRLVAGQDAGLGAPIQADRSDEQETTW
jgi:glycosyltransferase involved in cell wall biosynthesis